MTNSTCLVVSGCASSDTSQKKSPTSTAQKYVTPTETELLLSKEVPVEIKVADNLLTAKLRTDYGELISLKTR